ncbi:5-methylcytosine-specific restriction endonuclease system specificity protein McrC [Sulfitobacter geojensis]|uniref:5-methylcytosine-specific restriction endonuclease system specificity protein McrC n=1 Tax=Sulfitobacter geojensis TaxID=1342299 RepID=UPI00046A13BF|nr:5-methylcytosine-specific restriction endonuclease system specificity protein McrC [Sulfitobacter geojensis]KHA51919.1 5-methylcytosine-specific restriction enzyme subunit McrC [Sulfitobacter geojensis]NYI29326.1 5-methylcytosine-specific restriction enzyme subunit McrC [Sulfitobacter geojensis]
MEALQAEQIAGLDAQLAYDKIPLRNVWLLFLYASGLAQFQDRFEAEIEESPDFKSLVARLLCYATEKRLRRNLSFGYQRRHDVLRRVRGRIDILESVSRDLFRRGEVACRFDELTLDTPRNRLVLAALERLPSCLEDAVLAHRCRTLVHALGRAGVSSVMPSRTEIAADQIARHEGDDRLMISLAKAVFDLVLPTEQVGTRTLLKSQRDETEFRKLFEKAVANFFAAELKREDGWRVFPGKKFKWPVVSSSSGISSYLPTMETDIILENIQEERRVIIDTKFTDVLTKSQYGGERFKTGHIYQLYAYLRSQERSDDPMSLCSDGILLYPSIDVEIDETALIQNHRVRFVTIDLARPSAEVVEKLRAIPTLSSLLSS